MNTPHQQGNGRAEPPIDKRSIWESSQIVATISIIDGPMAGDKPQTRCAVICSVANVGVVRAPLTKQEAINLSRALIEAVQ